MVIILTKVNGEEGEKPEMPNEITITLDNTMIPPEPYSFDR